MGRADPTRTCVGCRRSAPISELIRIAMNAHGELIVSRAAPGRGAWLCTGRVECLRRAARTGRFDRAFRRRIRPGAAERLAERLSS